MHGLHLFPAATAAIVLTMTSAGAAQLRRLPPPPPPGDSAGAEACSPLPLATPSWSSATSLLGQQACGGNPWPYSAKFTPAGDRLYLPLFGGGIGQGGCVLLRVDPQTLAPLAAIPTGESPVEVAFVTHPSGAMRLGFVSNSTSSSVTVFDELDRVVATIAIPPLAGGPWPTAFPSGLVTSADQSRVFVSTTDGQGFVHAIDTATLALDPAYRVDLGTDYVCGRMVFAGDRLVIPASWRHPGGLGSTAYVVSIVPGNAASRRDLWLASDSTGFLFPSPQDCAVDGEGTVWVAGFDLGAIVLGIDPVSMRLLATVPTGTNHPDGKFQALGLSRDGLLVAADYFTGELACIDACRRQLLAVIDPALLPVAARFPQEVEFSPRTRTLVVPGAVGGDLVQFVH